MALIGDNSGEIKYDYINNDNMLVLSVKIICKMQGNNHDTGQHQVAIIY